MLNLDDIKKKILIVDDAPEIRSIIKDILSTNPKYLINTASNGYEAINIFNDHDLVISDICMPIMNGLDAFKILKPKNSKTIYIAMSSDSQPQDDCLKYGFNQFIHKPFNFNFILNTVNEYLF